MYGNRLLAGSLVACNFFWDVSMSLSDPLMTSNESSQLQMRCWPTEKVVKASTVGLGLQRLKANELSLLLSLHTN